MYLKTLATTVFVELQPVPLISLLAAKAHISALTTSPPLALKIGAIATT
jgi:hypothetical protein